MFFWIIASICGIFFFFFQAEDGIRDSSVTGVQTCALPIYIGRVVEAAEATFVDGGIIGPPPVPGVSSRIYLSGGSARDVAAVFAGSNLEAIPLDSTAGAASAVKACYAAWTKGATALLAAIRALATHEGVEAALLEEWRRSQPELPKRSEVVTAQARKAWRWIGEMEEIAASFEAAGLPGGFHLAAADLRSEE